MAGNAGETIQSATSAKVPSADSLTGWEVAPVVDSADEPGAVHVLPGGGVSAFRRRM